ncbi:MAG: MFS transporter [Chloroflexota bacterium]
MRPSLSRLWLGAGRWRPPGDLLRRSIRRLPWFRSRVTVEENNAWRLYNEVVWWGILSGVAGTFLGVFAVRLEASTQLMGLLTALPALVTSLCSMPAARMLEKQRRRLPVLLTAAALQRGGYLLVALLPFVAFVRQADTLVLLAALVTLPTVVFNVAFTTLLAEVVPPEKRATVVSVRNLLLTIISMATSLAGGWLLDHILFPYNYQLLFGVAAAASLLGLPHLRRLQIVDTAPPPQPRVALRERWRNTLSDLSSHGDFWRFSLGTFVFHWGLYLPIPLYNLYRVRELGASDAWVGLLTVVHNLTSLLPFVFWGKQSDRRGNRWVLLVSTAGLSLYPTLTGLSLRVEPLLLVSIWGGLFGPGFNIALFNALLDTAPAARRASYVGIHTTLINVAAFLAPLLGSALADNWGIRTILIFSGGARLVGVLAMWALGPHPRPRSEPAA